VTIRQMALRKAFTPQEERMANDALPDAWRTLTTEWSTTRQLGPVMASVGMTAAERRDAVSLHGVLARLLAAGIEMMVERLVPGGALADARVKLRLLHATPANVVPICR